MFYKMTENEKWIALVEDKQNIQTVAEVQKGGAAKQRLTIWSVNQYSIRILANIMNVWSFYIYISDISV